MYSILTNMLSEAISERRTIKETVWNVRDGESNVATFKKRSQKSTQPGWFDGLIDVNVLQ